MFDIDKKNIYQSSKGIQSKEDLHFIRFLSLFVIFSPHCAINFSKKKTKGMYGIFQNTLLVNIYGYAIPYYAPLLMGNPKSTFSNLLSPIVWNLE